MAGGASHRRCQRDLLGGGGHSSRPSPRTCHPRRAGVVETEAGGNSERELGEVGRSQPSVLARGGLMRQGMSSAEQGWAGPLPAPSEDPSWQASGLDGQLGGRRRSRSSRGRDAQVEGSATRASRPNTSAREERRWGEAQGVKFGHLRRGQEEEKEKKEEEAEVQSKDLRYKDFGGGVWVNRARPRANAEEALQAAGSQDCQEERAKGELEQFGEFNKLRGLRRFNRSRKPAFRRGGASQTGMEKKPRVIDIEYIGDDAAGGGHTERAAMGPGQIIGPSHIFPILETGPPKPDGRSHGSGEPNPVFPTGSPSPRESGGRMRCGDSAVEGIRADRGGGPFYGGSTPRARPDRGLIDDLPQRGAGSSQAASGGRQGSRIISQAVGEEERLGAKRGAEGQGQDKGSEGQRQRKGRECWTGQRREGQEVRATDGRELEGSVVETAELEEPTRSGTSYEGFVSRTVCQDGRDDVGPTRIPPFGEGDFSCWEFVAPTGAASPGDVQFSLEGKTFGEMANCFMMFFRRFVSDVDVVHSKIQGSGGVFPLPENLTVICDAVGQLPSRACVVLQMICGALNTYYGVSTGPDMPVTASAQSALKAMLSYAVDLSECPEKFEGVSWDQFLSVKSIDYKGDEVRLAKPIRWENLQPALPQGIGSIPLLEVCELGTLDFVQRFEDYLLPEKDRVFTKPPRVMVADDSWEQICSGLLSHGVCVLIPKSQVYHMRGRPLLNGLFGVSKDEFVDGWEVYRLIMNMIPVNRLCRNLGGDISTLPSWAGMTPYLLEEGQVIVMSSEDIRCFFYLFEIPLEWRPFMAFGKEVPSCIAPAGAQEPYFLASRVLPMGFLNSVSIAQHVHRRIARMSLHGLRPGVGSQSEIRKDKAFTVSSWAYRVYLDNFDSLERLDQRLAEQVRGEVSAEVLALREGYQHWGLPRHPKKSVQQEFTAEIQGALVDGVTGKVKPKAGKLLKYIELAWRLILDGRASQKQLQIVCGGFVYCSMFRRPLLGALNKVWTHIVELSKDPPVVRRELPELVKFELMRFICLAPLAQMNLRTSVLGDVTASDASEHGGGFCTSQSLTPMGVHAAHCSVRGDLPEVDDHIQVLTVGLFDGIGALRVAADVLHLPMGGHVSAEVSVEGSRVLESSFPDTLAVGDVTAVTAEMVQNWAVRYSNVGVVLVGGGPPCQGVSGLNADRKGALKDARSNLFVHVKRIYQHCKAFFPWAQVHFFMESVFSMDASDRATMSRHMEALPYMVDAAGISICRRPRLYWLSWELQEGPGVTIGEVRGAGWEGYREVVLSVDIDPKDFLCAGWSLPAGELLPTFTTSRPRQKPGNRPAGLWQCSAGEVARWQADEHRYPPYVYRDKHCLVNANGDRRLPNVAEKEAAMGFPIGYTSTCYPKSKQQGSHYVDTRHTLIGNSWHVPVVAWLLKELFFPLGLTTISTLQQVVLAATPGSGSTLQGYLRRPPLVAPPRALGGYLQQQLAKKLINFVSVKGEDLLLQAQSENSVRFHRLRASIPAKLWRWKVVCGWTWQYGNHHINVLEMNAIHTCLKWRLGRKRQHSCRFIHLTDSLVCLHALSRGRSSSRKLRAVLSKINSLLLATDTHPIWGYVSTHQNPADRPSRRPVLKRCLKRKRN